MEKGELTMPFDAVQAIALSEADFRRLLQNELLRRSHLNPSYSLRSFARQLEMDVSTLSKLLRGKRALGAKVVERLGLRLGLSPTQLKPFLSRGKSGGTTGTVDASEGEYRPLDPDHFEIAADGIHYSFLELLRIEGCKHDDRWMARALKTDVHTLRAATERLQRAGMLSRRTDRSWAETKPGATTTIGQAKLAEAGRRHQRELLQSAIAALDEVPASLRDQTSITVAVDPAKLPEARELAKQFRRRLAALMSEGNKREVYQISVSLFPVTNCTGRK